MFMTWSDSPGTLWDVVGLMRMFLGMFVVGCVGALCLGLELPPLSFP